MWKIHLLNIKYTLYSNYFFSIHWQDIMVANWLTNIMFVIFAKSCLFVFFFSSFLPEYKCAKVKLLVSTNRKQTSCRWYLFKGCWISGLCCQTCSSTVTRRTQVCKYLMDAMDWLSHFFFVCTLNSLLCSFDVYYFGSDCRRNLPVDLAEGVLRALCLQALGQVLMSLLYGPITTTSVQFDCLDEGRRANFSFIGQSNST